MVVEEEGGRRRERRGKRRPEKCGQGEEEGHTNSKKVEGEGVRRGEYDLMGKGRRRGDGWRGKGRWL